MSAVNRHIHQYWSARDVTHRILDAMAVMCGLVASLCVWGQEISDRQVVVGIAAVVVYFLTAEVTGMYRNWRGVSTEKEISCVIITWSSTLLLLIVMIFLAGYSNVLGRWTIGFWYVLTPILVATSRMMIRVVLRVLRLQGLNVRRYAIIGVNELGFQLARNIGGSVEMGLKLVGFFDDRPESRLPEIPSDIGNRIGDLDELIVRARQRKVDMIYITFPMRAEDRIKRILDKLGDTTASVYIVPDFFVFELLHSRWTSISGLPVVSVFENPFYGIDGFVKRSLDIILTVLILAITAIPMMLIAFAVKWSSPGPIFFRQHRYGLDGRQILVWKFRTMHACENGAKVTQATKSDPRVTRVGKLLRRTSLDELPQLFNVLAGTMSLVGPRPHANTHNEEYRTIIDGYMLRHKVKPGITGLAQVSGWRGETDTVEKMAGRIACDHQYIREWSLWMDIKILFKTVLIVFSQHNAY